MATRYAGDYFGISLAEDNAGSRLLEYFPGLRKVTGTTVSEPETDAKVKKEQTAPPAFAGFKTMERSR